MHATVTIEDVRIKKLSDGRELFIIVDSGGNDYTTMKRELAELARTWKGGEAMVEYEEKQNGQYTNRYLNGVKQANMSNNGFTVTPPQGAGDEQRRQDIARSVALKAAVDLAAAKLVEVDKPEQIITMAEFFNTWLLAEAPAADDIPF